MKRFLPLLFYLPIFAALSFFLWQRVEHEKQAIIFLNEPTDEAMAVLKQSNRDLQHEIKRKTLSFPSPFSLRYLERSLRADSLLAGSWHHPNGKEQLRSELWALTDSRPELQEAFQTALPNESRFSSTWQVVQAQNDTLGRLLAVMQVLRFCNDALGLHMHFPSFEPFISLTTPCPAVGDPFQADIFLSTYSSEADVARINVDGRPLAVEYGQARYRRTFPDAGVYPLLVEASFYYGNSDSMHRASKTFYLRVRP